MPDDNTTIIPPARSRRPIGIKGLIPSLPERGKIKIGIKGKMTTSQQGNKFQPPQKLDHFRVTTLERGADGNFVADREFHENYGDRPTEIPVRLLYDEPELNFPTRYACFIGRTLWCSGDGEVATRLSDSPPRNRAELDQMKPAPREVQCPCHRQDPAYDGRDKCRMNGSLSVVIEGSGGLGGVWKFRTTSYNSIVGIMGSMMFIRSITGGPLANLPLKLRITPKQATAPTDGSQVLIYVVGLEFNGDVAQLQQLGHQIALDRARTHVSIQHIEDEARRLLAAPRNAPLPGDDTDDVIDEFYPEQAHQPERPRPEEYREQAQQQNEAETEPQPFVVVDLAGEFVERADATEAADRLREVQDEAEAQRGDQGVQAIWESNAQLIYELRERGHDDVADAANAYYAERLANAAQHPHSGRAHSQETSGPIPHHQERKLPPEPGRTPRGLPFPSDEILPRGHNETRAPTDNPGEGAQPTQAERTESKSADLSHPNKPSTPPIPPQGTSPARDEKFWEPLPGRMPKEILYYADQLLRQCRDQTDVNGIETTSKKPIAQLHVADKEHVEKQIKEMISRRRAELAQ